MRKLIEASFVSLDGVVESAEQWALPYFYNEENMQYSLSKLMDCDAFLFGRQTYELIESTAKGIKGNPYYDRVNGLPKFVLSTTLQESSGNTTLIRGGAAEGISNLKQQPGKSIMKYGNGDLSRTLIENRLIDEFYFSIIPVVVGKGRRLFDGIDTSALKLRLTGMTKFKSGIVTLSYDWE